MSNNLKSLSYSTTPGTYRFTIPELAYCRVVKVVRENIVLLERTDNIHFTPLGREFMFHKATGRITVDLTNPFGTESVFIIYKDPIV